MDLLSRFAASEIQPNQTSIDMVRAYVLWQWGSETVCTLSDKDDIPLRSYLLQLKHNGLDIEARQRVLEAILQFYTWGQSCQLIKDIPNVVLPAERPTFNREKIRRREEIFPDQPVEREIARLKALNKLVGKLNRAREIHDVLSITQEALLEALALKTGWTFLLPMEGSPYHTPYRSPPHDFALAAASGLPPGLEHNKRYFLCTPGDCYCQNFFRNGGMKRAVNVVDCTRLADAAEAEGDNLGLRFHASVPIFVASEPAGIINVAAEDWQFLTASDLEILSIISAQVSEALERARLYDLNEVQRKRLENEIQLAREVQASLLPHDIPDIPGFSLAIEWKAAREVAGDFYDLIEFGDGCFGIVIADVSDKGAPAAMFMAMASCLIRTSASPSTHPADTLRAVNRRILAHSNAGMFVTVFYAILDTKNRSLTYASAGQDPPLLRRTSGEIETLLPTGPLIGLFNELEITDKMIHFLEGDALLIYTDGVVDAMNEQEERFETERMQNSFKNAHGTTAAEVLRHINADLERFTAGAPAFDDLTYVVLVSNHSVLDVR